MEDVGMEIQREVRASGQDGYSTLRDVLGTPLRVCRG